MAANHLIKAASSCSTSSINDKDCDSRRSASPEDIDVQLKSHSYERSNDNDHCTINNYATNGVISEAISDQGSSGDTSSCDKSQVEIKSKGLIKGPINGAINFRKGKLEEIQGGGYIEVLQEQQQEINMESDLGCNHEGVMYADVQGNKGQGAATETGDRGCIEGVNARFCKRDSADTQHGIGGGAGGGDRHRSSRGGGMYTAPTSTADRHHSGIAIAKYNSSFAAIKTEAAGYTDATSTRKCKRSVNHAVPEVENEAESIDCPATAGKMRRRKKFVGVRQRPSGRWVAEIKDTTQKIRMWLGTFDTPEAAARAYDEAACLLRGSNTRTNFLPSASSSPSPSPLASRLAHMLRARQNQNIALDLSSPTSPPQPVQPATSEPSHCNALGFSSSAYPHIGKPMQSSNTSANHYLKYCANTKQHANLYTNHYSFHNPYRKTYGNPQYVHMSNHGYSLQHRHPPTEAHNSPLRRSSRSESDSSDSDPSPRHIDTFPVNERHHMHLHDHFQVLSRDWDGFASVDGCDKSANGMPGYAGKELSAGEFSRTHLNSTNEDTSWEAHRQIFIRDKNVINAQDIDTLSHDQHSMRASHNYRGGGFMDALMGINDDIVMDPSEQMGPSYYGSNLSVSPFDFSMEASLGSSMMQVDEFPLINELSGKLEEAEGGGLHGYVSLHEEKGGSHHSHSSSNAVHIDHANLDLQLSGNLDGSLVCGNNSDLGMKRMSFERRASASDLYVLNGVHEMAMKQLTSCHTNPGSTNYLAGNSASTSFNFLSTSPSYMLSASSWKTVSSSAASSPMSACDESLALKSSINVNQSVINTSSLLPSSSSLSNYNCPSDTTCSNNNSTLPFSNMGSDTTANLGTSNSSINNNSSDAQSQEAAMWNSWDLPPLCTLVA